MTPDSPPPKVRLPGGGAQRATARMIAKLAAFRPIPEFPPSRQVLRRWKLKARKKALADAKRISLAERKRRGRRG